jgi:hypothetical protein
MKIALLIVVLAAAGGGFFGWQQHQELARVKGDLSATKASLDQVTTDARNAKADAAAARKEVEDQKAALQQARVDVEAAKNFLEMEKGHSARLQQELALAREQIAYMRTRSSAPARYSDPGVIPRAVVIQPSRIEAIRVMPSQSQSRAVGAGVNPAAPAPQEGYARPPQGQ